MAVFGLVILTVALAGVVFWVWARMASPWAPGHLRRPADVDVTDRAVMPPAPAEAGAPDALTTRTRGRR